ncbi:hypothetical protein [Nocardia wallacei]|uniref:hypothetical protein n=1 Tax=Nocardia wallacei TaxID=480035 RepID=UPI0024588BAD|nr:hypothetical protein [Nocardia wallacei]
MNARKTLAGMLIRVAHKIYPPQVTQHSITFQGPITVADMEQFERAARRVSRGWVN